MKYLIIGLGSMGNRRARNLLALGINKNDILGFDLMEARRLEFSKTHGIFTIADLNQAFLEKLKGVIVSTPPDTHMKFAKLSAEKGIPFFTEAGTTLEGMLEVANLAQAKGIVAAPSCTLRFHPLIVKMNELIRSETIGKILSFTHHCGQYLPDWHPWEDYRKFYVSKRSTGACREIVPFELTWLIWVLGWPAEIKAYKVKVSDLDCDIDDLYQILLKYENNAVGHLQVDVLARSPVRACRVLGSEGTIEWNAVEKTLRVYKVSSGVWETISETNLRVEAGYSDMSPEQMYINEMKAFVDALDGVQQFPHSYNDDIKILTILNKIEQNSDLSVAEKVYGEDYIYE